jgi:type IV pilus assembly protein PilE
MRQRGFTLIEIMIALAILGILVAIAYPAYTNQITRSNRATAKTALLELSQLQESYKADSNRYATSLEELSAANIGYTVVSDAILVPKEAKTTGKAVYTVALTSDGRTFSFTATPINIQSTREKDWGLCLTMSISSIGVKSSTGTGTTNDCW